MHGAEPGITKCRKGLLKLALAGAGGADALANCALRGLLSSDDAPLGPWPPGRDPLEDALRAYTGGASEWVPVAGRRGRGRSRELFLACGILEGSWLAAST